jgi:hypothetical protein
LENAFYYDGAYYLLPSGCENVESFKKSVNPLLPVRLTKLCENKCMAPYFVSEEERDVEVVISSARRVYPVKATILPRRDYEDRLCGIVADKCAGCLRLGDPDGHHGEMSLDGMCFEKQRKPYFAFYYAVQHFWDQFLKNEKKYRGLIDSGKADEAIKQIGGSIGFMIVPYLAVMKKGERYVLMFSAMADQIVSAQASYLVRRAPKELSDWDFYDYLPRGIFYYLPDKEEYDLRHNPPRLTFALDQCDRPRFHMIIRVAPCDDPNFDVAFENFLYLCAAVGENRLLASCGALDFVPIEGDEGQSVEAFREVLDAAYSDEAMKEFFSDWQSYSFEMCGQSVVSKIAHLSVDLVSGGTCSLEALWECGIPVGTLCFDIDMEDENWLSDYKYLCSLIDKSLVKKWLIIPVGERFSDKRVCIDFLIADSPVVTKQIRNLTPVFKAFSAKYTLRQGKQKITSKVEYVM